MTEEEKREKEEMVLSLVESKEYRPIRIKEMAALFHVPKKQRGELHDVLDALLLRGEIAIDRKGRIVLPKETVFVGSFMATQRGFGFVRVEGEREDIFIPGESCQNAFHGDVVQIRLTGDSGRRREGKIIKILTRKVTSLVGTFTVNGKITFVIPDDEKISRDIYIPKGATLGARQGNKVVVDLTDYGGKKKNPEGRVTEVLGYADAPGVDILSVIKGFGLPEEFPEEVLSQAENIPKEVKKEEYADRMDLRHMETVTIDGEDAKDLDDAITIEQRDDGSYELGVHIADVSHYVREHSMLDKEAKKRGTSVYLADRVIPMLPTRLSNGICSLNAGQDRLALSCIMVFDNKGKLIHHKILETLICVDERMSYTDVNDILAHQKEKISARYSSLVPMFETMRDLAVLLRKKRKRQGSIDFNFLECKIQLDESGHPMDIVPCERNIATKIIEEFMLAANQAVAEEYFWLEIPFLYRTHEYPDLEKIQDLARMTAGFGYHMKVGRQEVHPREIQKLIEQIEGTEEEGFLSRLTLRAMKRAKYSTVNEGHFGLATQYYCHFTSPIRRYPDLQIHRIIKENIHSGIQGERYRHYDAILPEVALSCSDLERRADEAEREVEKMKKAEYMINHIGETFFGVISGVTSWGIYVELPNTVEGMVRLSTMEGDNYYFDEENYRVMGHYTGREFRMGQKVEIRVEYVDKLTRTIDFDMMIGEDDG